MIRRSGISLPDILVATLLLGIWTSISIPYISGVGPGSRSSNLARDLHKICSWIQRYKLHHNGQLPDASDETSGGLPHSIARRNDANGDSDIAFGPHSRKLPVNPFSGRRIVRTGGGAGATNITDRKFDARTGALQAADSVYHVLL